MHAHAYACTFDNIFMHVLLFLNLLTTNVLLFPQKEAKALFRFGEGHSPTETSYSRCFSGIHVRTEANTWFCAILRETDLVAPENRKQLLDHGPWNVPGSNEHVVRSRRSDKLYPVGGTGLVLHEALVG